MWRCPPASGTPFITRPRAKKKPRGPTEESRPKQNLLVYPRTPPHRQVDAILPAASSTLERASELIDAKPDLNDISSPPHCWTGYQLNFIFWFYCSGWRAMLRLFPT